MKSTAKTRKVTRESSFPSAKEMLLNMSDEMRILAEKLTSSDGQPLSPEERELMRLSALPILNEIVNDIKMQYMATGFADVYELNKLITGDYRTE
jgi:hypothetical protein